MFFCKCVHESTITCMFPCITPVSAHFEGYVHCGGAIQRSIWYYGARHSFPLSLAAHVLLMLHTQCVYPLIHSTNLCPSHPWHALGVAPPSFFFIRAGTTLYELTTASGHISVQSILILAALAVLSLLPVFLRRTLRKKLE